MCLVASRGRGATAWREDSGAADVPGTAIAPARMGSAEPGTGRMTEGGPQVNSIARGCQNLVRPHRYAVSPNNAIRSAQGRVGAHRGDSHLSTPDGILMCCQKLRASAHLHRMRPLVRLL